MAYLPVIIGNPYKRFIVYDDKLMLAWSSLTLWIFSTDLAIYYLTVLACNELLNNYWLCFCLSSSVYLTVLSIL